MKTYQTIRPTENSNLIVQELNAKVLTSTFKGAKGAQLADLYTYEGTQCNHPKEIVAHNTCAPVIAKFVETIEIVIN
jgi:hypothetical protein